MIKTGFYLLLSCFVVITMTLSLAYAQHTVKDAFYFMKDDNEFSEEEMDEEAQYVYEMCNLNSIRSTYFNCECIAGAFRQEREKQGPYLPQNIILNGLFSDNERGCTNTVTIAGNAYEKCMYSSKIFRSREKNNEEYCKCVANTTARRFAKNPHLSGESLEELSVDAMMDCDS